MIRQRVRPDLLRGEASSELDEQGGSGGVLAERLLRACVVSMSNDDDGLLGAPRDDADDVAELDLAEVCEIRGPDVLLGTQPERRDRLSVPDRSLRRTFGAGHARRVVRGERLRERRRGVRVEQGFERRSLQRVPLSRSRTEKRETPG